MSSWARDARVTPVHVYVSNAKLFVVLSDGRVIGTPLSWYPSLASASQDDLNTWELTGFGVHWPKLDEDLSIDGMIAGLSCDRLYDAPKRI
jgi:hypothetical protein